MTLRRRVLTGGVLARHPRIFASAAVAAAIIYLSVFGTRYGLDLMVYRGGVLSWESGKDPYALSFTRMKLPFTYPPFALIALAPFGWTSFIPALWALWVVSLGATASGLLLVIRSTGVRLTASNCLLTAGAVCISLLVVEPVRSDMDYGQIELILMALVVIDFLGVGRGWRGILVGVVAAVKLTPLIFVITFLLMRDFKSAVRAIAAFTACTVATWIIFPSYSRKFWLTDVTQPGRTGSPTFAGNQCWYAVIYRMQFLGDAKEISWIALSLATLAVGAYIAWRCASDNRPAQALLATALTGLLISPISWTHHWVWVLLIPPIVFDKSGPEHASRMKILLAGIILLTCVAPYWLFQGGGTGDAVQALLPLYTGITLTLWAVSERVAWRQEQAPACPALAPTG